MLNKYELNVTLYLKIKQSTVFEIQVYNLPNMIGDLNNKHRSM